MSDVVTWTLNQYVAMGLMLGVFGFIGLTRGIRRELYASVAIVLAIVIVGASSGTLTDPINRYYRMFKFVRQGGMNAEDPAAEWQEIRGEPELIASPESQNALKLAVFATIVLLGYFMGQRFGPMPFGIMPRILGLFIGLFNGFGITYFLLPIIFPEPKALIEIPAGQVQQTMLRPEFLAQLGILFIFVMIAFGLFSASGRARPRQ
jgi:hypothetical protein